MAASLPNPRELKSWEDAFRYPLPAVRKLEQQLRSNAAENREKLRSLVGGSYRDLLGTAERICDMDETMQSIESTLSLTASKCNSGVVEKIFSNTAKLDLERSALDAQRNGLAAQLSLLRNCHSCISQLLKQDDQLYRAAKVLVLGRLVHKMLSQQPDAPPLVDGLRKRLASSESSLLKNLNRGFANLAIDSHLLVSNMCAYSLATSSAPTNVLYHFLKVRLEAIRSLSSEPRHARANMVRAVKLFKTSISASHAIFPRRLAEALGKVKLQPLLQDREVQTLAELNLDIYGRWIADDVRNFTPWPRHDELQRADAEKILKSWIPAALSSLKDALEEILQEQDDFETVLELRTAVLEAHINANEQSSGVRFADVLDIIRQTLNSRLTELVKLEAGGILALAQQIKTSIETSTTPSKPAGSSLWDLANDGSSPDDGSRSFKESVRNRLHGHGGSVQICVQTSESWESAITKTRARIQSMKERRWEDDILDAGADDDDFDLETQQAFLDREDPEALNEALNQALTTSLVEFSSAISAVIQPGSSPERAVFLVRVLRDLAQRTTTLDVDFDHAGVCQPLFSIIANSVVENHFTTYETALKRLVTARNTPAVALWEGHPAAPSQPTTGTFKLLRNVTQSMAVLGTDLWTPALVDDLKVILVNGLADKYESTIKAISAAQTVAPLDAVNGVTNGVASNKESDNEAESKEDSEVAQENEASSPAPEDVQPDDEQKPAQNGEAEIAKDAELSTSEAVKPAESDLRKIKAQLVLFDIHYLEKALSTATPKASPAAFTNAASAAVALAELPSDQHERVVKSASDYWRKTYLLFGLLA